MLVVKTWSSTGSILCLPGPCAAGSGGRVSCAPFLGSKSQYQIKLSFNDHHYYHVTGMYVLVEGFLNQVLRLESGESGDPLVQEYQLQVQSCPEDYLGQDQDCLVEPPEHEDVAVHLDLGDGGGGEGVSHCHKTHAWK